MNNNKKYTPKPTSFLGGSATALWSITARKYKDNFISSMKIKRYLQFRTSRYTACCWCVRAVSCTYEYVLLAPHTSRGLNNKENRKQARGCPAVCVRKGTGPVTTETMYE